VVGEKRWDLRAEEIEERLEDAIEETIEEARELRAGLWQNLA
jgi:hypothetical protein